MIRVYQPHTRVCVGAPVWVHISPLHNNRGVCATGICMGVWVADGWSCPQLNSLKPTLVVQSPPLDRSLMTLQFSVQLNWLLTTSVALTSTLLSAQCAIQLDWLMNEFLELHPEVEVDSLTTQEV